MLIRTREIYAKAAEELKLTPELVESVGSVVLNHLRECMSYPDEIAYDVKGLGTFALRQERFLALVSRLLRAVAEGRIDMSSPRGVAEMDRKKKIYTKVHQFKQAKKEKRKTRYEQITTKATSQDQPEKH